MSSAAVPMMIAGTAISAYGQVQQGNAAAAQGRSEQQASEYNAAALQQQSGQVMAATEASIAEQRTKEAYLQSSIRAKAAASGGSASDPTVMDLQGQVAARGEYNILSMLYSGKEKAAGLQNQAGLDIFTGEQQKAAGQAKQSAMNLAAIGSVISSGSSLYSKYGMGTGSGSSSSLGPQGDF